MASYTKKHHKNLAILMVLLSVLVFSLVMLFAVSTSQKQVLYNSRAADISAMPAGPVHPRNSVLYYIENKPMGPESMRPLVAYVGRDGKAKDWMFDGVVVFSLPLTKDLHANETAIATYINSLFTGGQLAGLANTVAALRTELHDPNHVVKVYLATPFVCADTDESCLTDKNAAARAQVDIQTMVTKFQQLNRPELQLVGFYYGYREEVPPTSGEKDMVKAVSDFLHQRGYEHVFSPFYTAYPGWKEYGFDYAALQPNFGETNVEAQRFANVQNRLTTQGYAGVNFEFGPPVENPLLGTNCVSKPYPDCVVKKAQYYMTAGDTYKWYSNSWNLYYWGWAISQYAQGLYGAPLQDVYDSIYTFMKKGVVPTSIPGKGYTVNGKVFKLQAKVDPKATQCPAASELVAGAQVELWGFGLPNAVPTGTANDGTFSFTNVSNGVYNVCIKPPYPNGYDKTCVDQFFLADQRSPYTSKCAKVEVKGANVSNVRFLFLKDAPAKR